MKAKAAELIKALTGFKNILIFIKGSPDPDAIASSFVIKVICDFYGIKSHIIAQQKLSLSQNKLFVKKLNIPLKITSIFPSEKYDAYVVLDHQSAKVTGMPDIPCAVHIDHHEKIKEDVEPIFSILSDKVGATSTIIGLLFKEMDIDLKPAIISDIATALVYGLQTDTDKYEHCTKLDYEALRFLSAKADNELISKLSGLPMSETTSNLLDKAVTDHIIYKEWLIAGVEYIDESSRDSIAIIADFLLRREKFPVVFVFAIIKHKNNPKLVLDSSVRTDNISIDLNRIIKSITSTGGARKFKGAFQIDLDFFDYYHDKQALWDMVSATAIEAIKSQRDRQLGPTLRGFLQKLTGGFIK